MKAAIDILLGPGEGKIAAGEEIPAGKFTDEQMEAFKAAGAIEGEGPAAEETVEGKMAPTPAKEQADLQAKERLSAPAAEAAAKEQAKAEKAGT